MVTYKGFQIKPHKEFTMQYIIVTDGKGGKIGKMLEGVYTSVNRAKEQIDTYDSLKGKG